MERPTSEGTVNTTCLLENYLWVLTVLLSRSIWNSQQQLVRCRSEGCKGFKRCYLSFSEREGAAAVLPYFTIPWLVGGSFNVRCYVGSRAYMQ